MNVPRKGHFHLVYPSSFENKNCKMDTENISGKPSGTTAFFCGTVCNRQYRNTIFYVVVARCRSDPLTCESSSHLGFIYFNERYFFKNINYKNMGNRICRKCGGSGLVKCHDPRVSLYDCTKCNGTGWKMCGPCRGTGCI